MGKEIKKIWFQVKDGKVHELLEDDDIITFPLGRAKCAPFPRFRVDVLFDSVNSIKSDEFCQLCVKLLRK